MWVTIRTMIYYTPLDIHSINFFLYKNDTCSFIMNLLGK